MAQPDEDLGLCDVARLREKIVEVFVITSNRDAGDARAPPALLARAQALVSWALAAGNPGGAPESSFEAAREELMQLYRRTWNLYLHYTRLCGTLPELRRSRQDGETRTPAEQAALAEHVRWITNLQASTITVRSAYALLDNLSEFEQIFGIDPERLNQILPMQQLFFERDFLRAAGVPEEDSPLEKEAGKKGQARYDLVHYCLDYALKNRWCRLGNRVYVERPMVIEGRRYRTRSYEPVRWPDGNERTDTGSIHEFVLRACSRQANPVMWTKLLVHNLTHDVVKYLQDDCIDYRFPHLNPLRRILSFRNGVYDTQSGPTGQFIPYTMLHACEALEPETAAAAKFFDQSVDAESCYATLAHGPDGWFAIPTPLFQSILDYQNHGRVIDPEQLPQRPAEAPSQRAAAELYRSLQDFVECAETACGDALAATSEQAARAALLALRANGGRFLAQIATTLQDHGIEAAPPAEDAREPQPLPPDLGGAPAAPPAAPGNSLPVDAQRMVYVLLGRLLHDLGHYDQWQILLFFKGRAGTGKSMIAMICQSFFEPQHIGTMANNLEEQFGIAQLADKFLWVCAEVKKNFKLDQALFQSIVSGENVSAAQKNRDAWTGRWRVPGLMCGNEWAAYQDAQGSIARRLAIVNFLYPIHEKDSNPQLLREIQERELGLLILKCNIAYRLAASAREGRDIWKVLPAYFKAQRRALQIDTDPLIAVLNDPTIFERSAASYVALKTLETEYRQRWRQIRGSNFPENLSDDKLLSALNEIGAGKATDLRADPQYGGEPRLDTWILGIRSVRDADAAARP